MDNEDAQLSFFVIEALGVILSSHDVHYLPIFAAKIAPLIADWTHPACIPADRKLGIFLIDDLLEHVGLRAVDPSTGLHYASTYLPVLARCATDVHAETRQAALYGIGAAAESVGAAMAPYLGLCVAALVDALSAVSSGKRKRSEVEDNAVTALGKVIIHQYDAGSGAPVYAGATSACPHRQDLVNAFLLGMPCLADRDEARVAVQMLCSFLDHRDPALLGGGGADVIPRLTHAVHIFAVTLGDKLVCTPLIRRRVLASLSALNTALPAQTLALVWGALPDADRAAIASASASTD